MQILSLRVAEKIIQRKLRSPQEVERAASILTNDDENILIEGISFDDTEFNYDYCRYAHDSFWLNSKCYPSGKNIEKQSMTTTAIEACIAHGFTIKDAMVIARMYVNQQIRLSRQQNLNYGTLNPWPEHQIDLPCLTNDPLQQLPNPFLTCENIGLYPIVDSSDWLKKLLPLGVKTIQLRIKDKQGIDLENEIRESIALAQQYETQLFINDYWQLAIKYKAYGIHLGQEDLSHANINAIQKANLRLGVSTHCYHEVARAHAFSPSYIACGPIFPTTTKMMPFSPQGTAQLARWRRTLNYPLVAIGGITMERLPDIMASGVNGIAIISAITKAQNPIAATKELLRIIK